MLLSVLKEANVCINNKLYCTIAFLYMSTLCINAFSDSEFNIWNVIHIRGGLIGEFMVNVLSTG